MIRPIRGGVSVMKGLAGGRILGWLDRRYLGRWVDPFTADSHESNGGSEPSYCL